MAAPSAVLPVLIGDFNNDGNLDIALPDTTSNLVRILLGNGDGTFTLAKTTSVTQSAQMLVAGDFNGDGIPDLLAISTRVQAGSYFQVLIGKGDGTFTAETAIAMPNENLVWAAVGDFNRDSRQDIAYGYYTGTYAFSTPASTLAVLKGNGDGTFATTPVASYPQNLYLLATGDFDGDGIPDIMTGGADYTNQLEPGTITYYRCNGDFTFSSKGISTVLTPQGFIPGDYLGDGTLQLAASFSGVNVISATAADGYSGLSLKRSLPQTHYALIGELLVAEYPPRRRSA